MKGIILVNAFSTSKEYLYQAKRLKEEFNKKRVDIDIKKNNFFPAIIDSGDIKLALQGYEFCVFWDKDKYILKALSMSNIPIFNSYESIIKCDDKMLSYLELTGQGFSMPKTLPGFLCYELKEKISINSIIMIENELSYPFIIKKSYGSLGKGVYLVNNRIELIQTLEKVKTMPHLLQEFIKASYGKDIRIIVIGNKVIGAMLRQSENDFRSNIAVGGCGMRFIPPKPLKEMAEKISKILKLDYCGIDFLINENGEYFICEVNSNAFFLRFEQTTNINVALKYVEHILVKLNKNSFR